MSRPTLTVIAGANGAGKSSLTAGNPGTFAPFPLLDPDAFARPLRPIRTVVSPIAAGKEVLRLARQGLGRRESFAVETTLSGNTHLQMMNYARGLRHGFEVLLIYIGTESVEINLARVAKRVQVGGHDVPEGDVRRRYVRSFRNLPTAFRIADSVLLFDNSEDVGFRPVGVCSNAVHGWFDPLPAWAAELKGSVSKQG